MSDVQPAYRVGFCPQCQAQIMVRDTHGMFTTFKGNYRQVHLTFDDGHKIRVPICSKCIENVDADLLMKAITHDDTQATRSKSALENIKFKTKVETDKDGEITKTLEARKAPTKFAQVLVKIKKG